MITFSIVGSCNIAWWKDMDMILFNKDDLTCVQHFIIYLGTQWSCIICVAQLAMYYMWSTTGHVLHVWHTLSYITCVVQLAMYYMCGTTGHVLNVWHNWPCITRVAQLAMYYMCGTPCHILHVWHNWPCITCVAQLAMYYMCGTIVHVFHVWHTLSYITYVCNRRNIITDYSESALQQEMLDFHTMCPRMWNRQTDEL